MDNSESTGQTPKKAPSKFILPLVIVVLILLVGAGGYLFMANKNNQQKPDTQAVVAQNALSPTSGSVISSIKEALAGSQSLQCDFTDETGRQTTTYMKSGAIRTDFTASDPKQSGSMIMKDNKMYFWNGKAGTVMAFDIDAILEKAGTPAPTSAKTSVTGGSEDQEAFINDLEKYKQSCRQATVDDGLFVPPSDVKFTDLSAMMQGERTNPSGVPSITEEQMKALQEQFQQ